MSLILVLLPQWEQCKLFVPISERKENAVLVYDVFSVIPGLYFGALAPRFFQ